MIGVHGVSHRYGHRWVLRDVTLRVAPGSCLALFGPNGAGKTTLLRILAGMLRPSEGELLRDGAPVRERDERRYRRRIGFVGHEVLLYPALSAEENLRFFAGLYGVAETHERIRALLERVDLTLFRRDPVATYSEGMRRRLALARALLHQPEVLVLDEPDAGMDAAAQALLDDVIRTWRAGERTVVLATHDLEVGLARADRHAVLQGGRVVAGGEARAGDAAAVAAQLAGGAR